MSGSKEQAAVLAWERLRQAQNMVSNGLNPENPEREPGQGSGPAKNRSKGCPLAHNKTASTDSKNLNQWIFSMTGAGRSSRSLAEFSVGKSQAKNLIFFHSVGFPIWPAFATYKRFMGCVPGHPLVEKQSRNKAYAQALPWQVPSKPNEKRNNRASYHAGR